MKLAILAVTIGGIALIATAGRNAEAPDGKTLYLKNCRQCHGATGTPSSQSLHKYPKIKTLSDAAFRAARSNDSRVAVMKKGAGRYMKYFKDKLTADEMTEIAKYVRTLTKDSK